MTDLDSSLTIATVLGDGYCDATAVPEGSKRSILVGRLPTRTAFSAPTGSVGKPVQPQDKLADLPRRGWTARCPAGGLAPMRGDMMNRGRPFRPVLPPVRSAVVRTGGR